MWQIFGWLKTAEWQKVSLETLGAKRPETGWAGVQTIISKLWQMETSVVLLFSTMALMWIVVHYSDKISEQAREDERRIREKKHSGAA